MSLVLDLNNLLLHTKINKKDINKMYNEKKVALTIYIISIMQMSALAVAPALTAITQKFS